METDKNSIIINHPLGDCTLQSIQDDVNAAQKIFGMSFSFTYLTVQALIDKIKEQDEKLSNYCIK